MNNFAYIHPRLYEALEDELINDMFFDKASESVRQDSDEVGELVELIGKRPEATNETIIKFSLLMDEIRVQVNDEFERLVNEQLCDNDVDED